MDKKQIVSMIVKNLKMLKSLGNTDKQIEKIIKELPMPEKYIWYILGNYSKLMGAK